MIYEIAAAMAGGVPTATIGRTIHAYPTLSRDLKESFARLAGSVAG